jgi:hypothetical protein
MRGHRWLQIGKNAGMPLTHYFFKQIIDIKNLIDIVRCMEKTLVIFQ